jgi:hypothetical protein
MPLLHGLDFAARDLVVRYHASPTAQNLAIEVRTAGVAPRSEASLYARAIVDFINAGAAGGGLFAPQAGFAELLSEPPPPALGPSYAFVMRVAGVDPVFLRRMVERLRLCGVGQPTVGMSIVGSLPLALALDASPLSITERDVRAWLDDPAAYPAEWPDIPFPLSRVDAEDGVALRLDLTEPIKPAVYKRLETLFSLWLEVVLLDVSEDGREVLESGPEFHFQSGFGKSEYRACLRRFDHARGPPCAALMNMLTRFHAEVCPILEAEVRL